MICTKVPTVADLSEGHHRMPKYKRSNNRTLKSYNVNVTKCK